MKKTMGCQTSPSKCLKGLCGLVAFVLVFELLVFNYFFIHGFFAFRNTFVNLPNLEKTNWVDSIQNIAWARKVVNAGKSGGFVGVLQNTLERLFYISPNNDNSSSLQHIGTFSLDVSHSGEFLFIYKRMLSRRDLKFSKLVIDVGANDGLMSSNSFNFIQLGWSALLLEPLESQAKMAEHNIARYVDPYKDSGQTVNVIRSVIGDKDGNVKFIVTDDLVGMEGHIKFKENHQERSSVKQTKQISVKSLTVKTFTDMYSVPKYFGLLSVDAEGTGNKILHDFIGLGYRPAYIIYEALHEQSETPFDTKKYLNQFGYQYLAKRGWNLIFEYKPSNKKS
ncbi:hypothetical protein FSP39_008533 [Pinctada imbricata]|uniref:Methyltransferase FkbM domain-containing protein n=1 Tax=Pinctada imbricata TaxID=66713 RepID=A0AA88YBS1_PINIB|nr:hypothetical protein FSP39_008533 [Pinctada imbricata]